MFTIWFDIFKENPTMGAANPRGMYKMLGMRETEQLAGAGRGRLGRVKQRQVLPFASKPRVVHGIMQYSPMHALALNLQAELCDQFGPSVKQAAEIVIHATPGMIKRWHELVTGVDLWIVTLATPEDQRRKVHHTKDWRVAVSVLDRDELTELVKSGEEPPAELREKWEAMALTGASNSELFAAMRKDWQPPVRRVWPLHLSGVFAQLLTRAEKAGIPLPPLSDVKSWCEVRV